MTKEKAEELGVALDFFQVRKRNNPEQHKFMMSFADDEFESYDLYLEYKEEVAERAREIYIHIEDNRLKSAFGNFLIKEGVYNNHNAYGRTENSIFGDNVLKQYKSLLCVKRSNELFDEFLNS